MKVYIDGENCRKSLSRFLVESGVIANPRAMQSYKLRELLADLLGSNDFEAVYYASEIKLPRGYQPSDGVMQHVEEIRAYNRRWVPSLMTQKISYIKAGNLKVKQSKPCRNCHETQDILQEKGVDVRLATDMLEDAYTKKHDTVVILSSDTDLCPALHKVQSQGIKVIYVGFADSLNRAMISSTNATLTISIPKLRQYAT